MNRSDGGVGDNDGGGGGASSGARGCAGLKDKVVVTNRDLLHVFLKVVVGKGECS